jgi:hypothetical protein
MKKIRALSIILTLLTAAAASAQTVSGTIDGHVTDPSGASVPNAKIAVKGAETGMTRTTNSNAEGYYQLTFLPVGEYSLSVEAAGFGTTRQVVTVSLNQTYKVDFALKPASLSTEVTVTVEAPIIDTSTGEVKSNIDQKTIEDRPMSSRNILSLIEMLPGFQTSGSYGGVNNPTLSSGSYVAFNGTGSRSAAFQIDGVNNDDSSEGTSRQNVNLSAIREFQVLTNTYSAQFGRAGGAVVLVQTKNGTNALHGDAYEFLQNEKLNANSFFNNSYGLTSGGQPVSPRAPYRRNQFGYTVGGPILKDKLFFFHSFEQTRLRLYNTYNRFLPPITTAQVGTCRLCLNPAEHPNLQQDLKFVQYVLDLYPKVQPNNPTCPTCYTGTNPASWPDQDYSGRIDWNARPGDTVAVRYQYSRQRRVSDSIIPSESTRQNNRQQNVGLTQTHMFNATTWGEFRFGLGLRTTLVDIAAGNDTPIIRVNNPTAFSGGSIGSAGQYPIHRYQTDYQYVYNLSHVHGRHNIQAGIDFRRQHLDDLADNYSRGWWTFGATGVVGQASRYEGWENLMRGYYTAFDKGWGNFTTFNRTGEFSQYAMDDIKLLPNFTLNLGFRWEVVLAPREASDKIKYGYDTFTGGYQPRFGFAWSPKFEKGLLRKLTGGPGRTGVRGGFGMFHNRIFQSVFSQGGISLRSLPPYGVYRSFNASFNVAQPWGTFDYQPGSYDPGRIASVKVDPGLRMPEIQQLQFTVERQLPGKIAFSAGYNRTRGIGLLQNESYNRARFPIVSPMSGILYDKIDPDLGNTNPAPGYISAAQPRINERRPDARYTTVTLIRNGAWTYFNALRLSVTKRFSQNMHWTLNYSLGKTIDTGSDVTGGAPIAEFGAAVSNRGLSDFDQRQRLNLNFVYYLPALKSSRAIVKHSLGGWTLSSNMTAASGNPFTVTAGIDLNGDGVNNDRPILLNQSLYYTSVDNPRPDAKGAQISTGQLPISGFYPTYTTTTAQRPFAPGGTGAGSIGRNTFFGQGLFNLDLGIYKTFPLPWKEGHRIIFRTEMYGATNTPHFALPTRSTNSQAFGTITSTYNPFNYVGASRSDASARVIQFALRYVF